MSNKKISFFIFNSIIVLIILLINNSIIYIFNSFSSWYLIGLVSLVSVFLYFGLSRSLVDDVFSIDDKLKQKIETTMHEINTPVSTIQINTDILQTNLNDADNLERLDRINKACDNLLSLYEDMEYYIKKEIDRVEIVSFDLRKLLLHCIDKFDDIKKDIHIKTDIEPIIITTDKNGFEKIIDNLISNAIKHNITIKNIDIKFKNNILSIVDDGEGIQSQNIYNIFDKYFQSDNETEGFGIGLNIVKEFCDKNKIDISINSSERGTVFNMNLTNIIEAKET